MRNNAGHVTSNVNENDNDTKGINKSRSQNTDLSASQKESQSYTPIPQKIKSTRKNNERKPLRRSPSIPRPLPLRRRRRFLINKPDTGPQCTPPTIASSGRSILCSHALSPKYSTSEWRVQWCRGGGGCLRQNSGTRGAFGWRGHVVGSR